MAVVLVAAGCGSSDAESVSGEGDSGDTAAVLAAAVQELITVDHTFGEGPPPFTDYLLLDATDPAAGSGDPGDGVGRTLTDGERSAIEEVVSNYGSVQWIADPGDYRTDDLRPTVEGAAIVGVGEPVFDQQAALVPVSLWCGGLCGTWLTYRVEVVDGTWVVTGVDGPIAIS